MTNTTTTENWDAISQLFSLTETKEIKKESHSETTSSGDNWDAISNLFGISATTEEKVLIPPTVLGHGQFVVEAVNSKGVSFFNPLDRTVQVTFVPDASAQWTLSKNSLEKWPWVTVITGMGKTYSSTIAPNLFGAALVVRTGSSSNYEIVGEQKTILLQPEESVTFFCNDGHFGDNDGSVTIFWLVEAYQGILTRDDFEVEAANEYSFSNPFDRAVQLHFVPEGEWKTNSKTTITHTGKTGSSADNTYLAPGQPVGCLLVKVNDKWEAVGESKSLTLQKNASLEFACNLKKDDNPKGTVTVKWVLEQVL